MAARFTEYFRVTFGAATSVLLTGAGEIYLQEYYKNGARRVWQVTRPGAGSARLVGGYGIANAKGAGTREMGGWLSSTSDGNSRQAKRPLPTAYCECRGETRVLLDNCQYYRYLNHRSAISLLPFLMYWEGIMPRLTTLVLGFVTAILCGSLLAANTQPTIQSVNKMPLAFTQNNGNGIRRSCSAPTLVAPRCGSPKKA